MQTMLCEATPSYAVTSRHTYVTEAYDVQRRARINAESTSSISSFVSGAEHMLTANIRITRVIRHSWFNLHVHIPRSNNTFVRAILHELVFMPYGVYVRARFGCGRTWKTKEVQPIVIACIHMLWLKVDIVSDDDATDEPPGRYNTSEECTQTLPELTINQNVVHLLSDEQRQCFEHLSHQVSQILSISNSFHTTE
jgi:hypothetical protein